MLRSAIAEPIVIPALEQIIASDSLLFSHCISNSEEKIIGLDMLLMGLSVSYKILPVIGPNRQLLQD